MSLLGCGDVDPPALRDVTTVIAASYLVKLVADDVRRNEDRRSEP
jgi:hypothetical protein